MVRFDVYFAMNYSDYIHKGELYRELVLNHNIVPIGLYRMADEKNLGNRLPFVYTNPLQSLLLRETDLIYVLAPNSNEI